MEKSLNTSSRDGKIFQSAILSSNNFVEISRLDKTIQFDSI